MRFWIVGIGVAAGSLAGVTGEVGHALPGLMLAVGALAAFSVRRRSA
jgi:MYXO-CTERM domain-containing protein